MDTPPIGIFDSGLGGLSIAQAIWQHLPNESTIYLADHKFCPYGDQPARIIKQRLDKAISFFTKKQVKLIVIACNTATVMAIDYLRKKYSLPFIGTVPAIKPALKLASQQKIVVLTTSNTAASNYYHQLSQKLDKHQQIISLPCPGLVDTIEQFACQPAKIKHQLKHHLNKLPKDLKAIVLGCTHYILIKDLLKPFFKKTTLIFEPSQAIAKQVGRILKQNKLLNSSQEPVKHNFFTTANSHQVSKAASCLIKPSIMFSSCRL